MKRCRVRLDSWSGLHGGKQRTLSVPEHDRTGTDAAKADSAPEARKNWGLSRLGIAEHPVAADTRIGAIGWQGPVQRQKNPWLAREPGSWGPRLPGRLALVFRPAVDFNRRETHINGR